MYRPLENHMVIGDYYPDPKPTRDEDAEYDQWRDRQDEIKREDEAFRIKQLTEKADSTL